MIEIRSALDFKTPSVIHGLTVVGDPVSRDPATVTTVVGQIVARVKRPVTSLRAEHALARVRIFSILAAIFPLFWALVPLGLLFVSPTELMNDPLYVLLYSRSFGMQIFWSGVLVSLFFPYCRALGQLTTRSMTLRPIEEAIPVITPESQARTRKPSTLAIDDHVDPHAARLVASALFLARERGHRAVRPVHVVLEALQTAKGRQFLRRSGVHAEALIARLERLLSGEPAGGETGCDALSYAILHAAFLEAYRERLPLIGVLELLTGALRMDDRLQEVLLDLGITLEDASHIAAWVRFEAALVGTMRLTHALAGSKPKGHMDMAFTARPTPLTDSLTTDFTYQARLGKMGPLLGRDETLGDIFRILHGEMGNVLLVGDPGCGKTEILRGIAQQMAAEDVPDLLKDKRCLCLDPGSLIAGADGVGTIEARVKQMIREITRAGNILLVIEDIHHLLGAGSTRSSEDAGSMLMNALSQHELTVIATTTTQEFSQYVQPRGAFLRRFQVVRVTEMDRAGTLRVLEAGVPSLERRHRVFVGFGALASTYELCDRYLPDRRFPDKAIRILEEACSYARQQRGAGASVGREDVAKIISGKTRSLVTAISDVEADELLLIEESLRRRVVGQDEAIHAIGSALRRARTGLRRTDRPIATLFFLGPTGVGKTETAKAIAALSFGASTGFSTGGEDRMIRLDMSEYQTPESLEKLLGTNGKTSPFLDAVRRCPAHLLLLDEFEKASPDVLNIFLQLFEDGRLTDGRGETVSFTEALIIATSNLGSMRVHKGIADGRTLDEIRDEILHEELLHKLRPEMVNRFDRIILFRPLTMTDMNPIVGLQLRNLSEALERQGLYFQALPEAIHDLAKRGYDPLFGARGLRRLIQDTVEDEVAKLLLQGRAKRRDTIIVGSHGAIAVRAAEMLA